MLGRKTSRTILSCLPVLSFYVEVFTSPKQFKRLALTWCSSVWVTPRSLVLTAQATNPCPTRLPPLPISRLRKTLEHLSWTLLKLLFRVWTLKSPVHRPGLTPWPTKENRIRTEVLRQPQRLYRPLKTVAPALVRVSRQSTLANLTYPEKAWGAIWYMLLRHTVLQGTSVRVERGPLLFPHPWTMVRTLPPLVWASPIGVPVSALPPRPPDNGADSSPYPGPLYKGGTSAAGSAGVPSGSDEVVSDDSVCYYPKGSVAPPAKC